MKHLLLFVLSILISVQSIGQKQVPTNYFKQEILNSKTHNIEQSELQEKYNLASSGQFIGIAASVAGVALVGKGLDDKLSSVHFLTGRSEAERRKDRNGTTKILAGLLTLGGSIALFTTSTISKKRISADYNKRRMQQEKEPFKKIKYRVSIDTKKIGFAYQF